MDEMGRWGVDFTLAQVHLPRGHHLSTGLAQGYRGLHGSPKELKSSQEGQRPPPPSLPSQFSAGQRDPLPSPAPAGLARAVTQFPRLAVRLRLPGHVALSWFSNDAFHKQQSPGAAQRGRPQTSG